jgi:hypothetical protein
VILKRDILAAEARRLIDMHDEWDSPYCIVTLHPDGEGEGLHPGTWVTVMPDVDPRSYPALIARAAAETQDRMPEDPAYAYAFQGEFFGMEDPGPKADAAERERFRKARVTRTFHEQPDATETAIAWVADVHGRTWYCAKARKDGEIAERFYRTGGGHGGAIVDALVRAGRITGMAAWGIPPVGSAN